jgi:hypothetical protein
VTQTEAMVAKRQHNISEAGREAMRLSGRRQAAGSFAAMKQGEAVKRGIRDEVDAFRRDLTAKVNVAEHPHAIALVRSAAASFAAICQISLRLSTAKGKGTERLAELLPTLQSELRRTLELLLGVTTGNDHSGLPSEDTPEAKRAWARRYVDSLVPEVKQ